MDLFQIPSTDTTREKVQYIQYRPKSQFQEGAPLEFIIPSGGNRYIDLKKSYINVKVKVLKNGKSTELTDSIAPINLSLHSLFSRVEVYFNQKLVSGSERNYPYKAYLECLLDYGRESKETQLSSAGYYKDKALHMEEFTGENNGGFSHRMLETTNGKVWELEGSLMSDICQQERYIINQTEIMFKCYTNISEFFLLTANEKDTFKYQITDACMYVCMITPTPWLIIAHNEALDKSNAVYPYHRTDIKTISVGKGEFGFQIEDIYQGLIPKVLIIAMVKSGAYHGALDKNPYNLEHFGISNLSVKVDGQPTPSQPLSLRFTGDNQEFLQGYNTIFRALDKDSRDVGCDITQFDYEHGYCLFVFDLIPGEYLPLIKRANLRVDARFESPLKENITVLLTGKFPSTLEIDRERNIFTR